jgi:hypothetical protein
MCRVPRPGVILINNFVNLKSAFEKKVMDSDRVTSGALLQAAKSTWLAVRTVTWPSSCASSHLFRGLRSALLAHVCIRSTATAALAVELPTALMSRESLLHFP